MNIDDLSDEELARLIKRYANSRGAADIEKMSNLDAFCDWLNLVGLGKIASAIRLGQWAWQKVKKIWDVIFG